MEYNYIPNKRISQKIEDPKLALKKSASNSKTTGATLQDWDTKNSLVESFSQSTVGKASRNQFKYGKRSSLINLAISSGLEMSINPVRFTHTDEDSIKYYSRKVGSTLKKNLVALIKTNVSLFLFITLDFLTDKYSWILKLRISLMSRN